MVTKGERRIGRTIRKLENSVELSNKESRAKNEENKYQAKVRADFTEDSPVESLHKSLCRRIDSAEH